MRGARRRDRRAPSEGSRTRRYKDTRRRSTQHYHHHLYSSLPITARLSWRCVRVSPRALPSSPRRRLPGRHPSWTASASSRPGSRSALLPLFPPPPLNAPAPPPRGAPSRSSPPWSAPARNLFCATPGRAERASARRRPRRRRRSPRTPPPPNSPRLGRTRRASSRARRYPPRREARRLLCRPRLSPRAFQGPARSPERATRARPWFPRRRTPQCTSFSHRRRSRI
mmetsp:Transcript_13848/g.59266  ORF Transcript_13848/g.59266 Transcript_13848/m.59266 type:complete len:226 (+) Transcript_13848:2692-3369(+)